MAAAAAIAHTNSRNSERRLSGLLQALGKVDVPTEQETLRFKMDTKTKTVDFEDHLTKPRGTLGMDPLQQFGQPRRLEHERGAFRTLYQAIMKTSVPRATTLGNLEEKSSHLLPIVESKCFAVIIYSLIILNAIQMGLALDMQEEPWIFVWDVMEHFFTAAFLVEFFFKITAYRMEYWSEWWNRLDFSLVLLAVLDCWVLPLMASHLRIDLGKLTVLRMLRILRVARMLRFLKAFRELWVITVGILHSFRTMAWISLLLLLALYICAILCVIAIGQETELYPGYDEENIRAWYDVRTFNNYQFFGSVPRSMYTLFNVVILSEWSEIGRAIIEIQPYMFVFFVAFISFTTFGVMNVIIGVIVDNTMAAAKELEKNNEQHERDQKIAMLTSIQQTVKAMDRDGDDMISMDELREGLRDRKIVDLFEYVNMPLGFDADELLDLLDVNGEGQLTNDTFMLGLFRMVDNDAFQTQCLIIMNLHRIYRKVKSLEKTVQSDLVEQLSHKFEQRFDCKFAKLESNLNQNLMNMQEQIIERLTKAMPTKPVDECSKPPSSINLEPSRECARLASKRQSGEIVEDDLQERKPTDRLTTTTVDGMKVPPMASVVPRPPGDDLADAPQSRSRIVTSSPNINSSPLDEVSAYNLRAKTSMKIGEEEHFVKQLVMRASEQEDVCPSTPARLPYPVAAALPGASSHSGAGPRNALGCIDGRINNKSSPTRNDLISKE